MSDEKRKVTGTFGIKLYPDEIDRFKKIKGEMDEVKTDRDALLALLDFFENPKTVEVFKDSEETLQRVEELETQARTDKETIDTLRSQLEESQQLTNSNAEAGSKLQLQLDEKEQRIAQLEEERDRLAASQIPANYIGGLVDPITRHFLRKMAKLQSSRDKKTVTEFDILTKLFYDDINYPRSNNLIIDITPKDLRLARADFERQLKEAEKKKEASDE